MRETIKDKTAIAGIGQTRFGKGFVESELELGLQAAAMALEDAGLTGKDVDGIVRFGMQKNDEIEFARNLGCRKLRFWAALGYGGGAASAIVVHAAMAVASGMADAVLCVRSRKRSDKASRIWAQTGERVAGHLAFEVPYGSVKPVDQVAMFARWHMCTYGTTTRHFGEVAVAQRANAVRNPNATMRAPISLEDHQNSRMISDPLRLLDNCVESDGACAVVVTSAEQTKSLRQRPVYISGAVMAASPDPFNMSNWYKPGKLELHCNYAAEPLYGMAGVKPADIDVALIYDVFTPLVIMQLEAYGFCKPGEGGPFVEGGRIAWPNGELPVNTHGGSLSEAYIHGSNHINEAVKQLRGTATNQVENAELALVTSGPPVPTSALILRR